jgi:hypothetical protein
MLKDLVCGECNKLFSTYERAWTSAPGEAIARIYWGPAGRKRKGAETYYGNSSKRSKGYQKGHSKKAGVAALVEPKGRVRAFHVKTANAKTVRELLVTNVHRTSELHTDESRLYIEVGREFHSHKTVEHSWNQHGYYVGKDGQTTNAVENFFGNFKRSMKGTYRFCGEQHLARYLAEFEFATTIAPALASTTGNGRRMRSRVSMASA